MLRRYSRLLVALYVVSDAMLGVAAFGLAYVLRFSTSLVPVTRGYPPFEQYVAVMPFIAVLVPLAYYFQGVYRLRRGRSRVDDFFLVFIGSVVAVILGIRSEEHTSELQSLAYLVCRLLLEKKKYKKHDL